MLKSLTQDSVYYATATVVQKLVPFLIIPLITRTLGGEALKLYDISFVYAYLVAWLLILGQDNAGSIRYFAEPDGPARNQVLVNGLVIQGGSVIAAVLIFVLFSGPLAALLFGGRPELMHHWTLALLVVPGYVVLNYAQNILIWQRRRKAFLFLALLHTVLSLGGCGVLLLRPGADIAGVFRILIGATSVTAVVALVLVRSIFSEVRIETPLIRRLLVLGWPFALTSFLHQLLPSIDRSFLVRLGYESALPQYALAVKVGGLLSVAASGFVLAFTPFSMSRLHRPEGPREVSLLFRFVSALAFLAVPVLLLFRHTLVRFFAGDGYADAAGLLPPFFFAWVFDLFGYFALLGVYKSGKSWIVLLLFFFGVVLAAALNLVLVPLWGPAGAAWSLCISKLALFVVPLLGLRRPFPIQIDPPSFFLIGGGAGLCAVLIYRLPGYQAWGLVVIVVLMTLFYLFKLFARHRRLLAL